MRMRNVRKRALRLCKVFLSRQDITFFVQCSLLGHEKRQHHWPKATQVIHNKPRVTKQIPKPSKCRYTVS